MARTITITRGNQYAADGYHITDGTLASYGRADASKPGGYCLDGRLHPWCLPNAAEIDAAILATLADGQTRQIEVPAAAITVPSPLTTIPAAGPGTEPKTALEPPGDTLKTVPLPRSVTYKFPSAATATFSRIVPAG